MSRACLFMLFTDEKRTNLAVQGGALFRSRTVLWLHNIHQNTVVNLQMNMFIFFSGRFFLMSPLNKNPVERRTQYMAFVYCLNSVFSKNHAQRTVFESTEY